MTKQPINNTPTYHAHVYFNAQTLAQATALCQQAGELFPVNVGKMHQKIVGPHPCWSCRLGFDAAQFEQIIPWLTQNRNGLTILIHGITGNDLEDHTTHASWLGDPLALNLSAFDA